MDLRYWASAGRSLGRHLRRSPSFRRDLATAGLRADLEPCASVVHVLDAFPGAADIEVDMGLVTFRLSNLDPYERYAVAALAVLRKPRRILEIGTYDGATTLLLARAAPDAEIFTLDLPPESAGSATVTWETDNAAAGVGSRFRGDPDAVRITQLLGDSRTFDFSPWHGTIDLVLVDGGHAYEPAKADTGSAQKLLASGGMIIWDDYTVGWPGVVRAVDESGLSVIRLAGTDLAVHDAAPLG